MRRVLLVAVLGAGMLLAVSPAASARLPDGLEVRFSSECVKALGNPNVYMLYGSAFVGETRDDVNRARVIWKLMKRPIGATGSWDIIRRKTTVASTYDYVQPFDWRFEGGPPQPPVDGTKFDWRLKIHVAWYDYHAAPDVIVASADRVVTTLKDHVCTENPKV
jgi:hypothetical protein